MALATLIETEEHTKFTVEEYLRMDRAGVFADRRVELVRGRIYEMAAQGIPHVESISRTNVVLTRHFSDMTKYWLCMQGALTLSKYDAPEPDFFLFDVPIGTPEIELPTPILIVEISRSTLRKDRGPKLQSYAEYGVQEYWIVNLEQQQVEVYRSPIEKGVGWRYADRRDAKRGETITMLSRPDVVVEVDEILARV